MLQNCCAHFWLCRALINTRKLAWCLFLQLIVLCPCECFKVQMLPPGWLRHILWWWFKCSDRVVSPNEQDIWRHRAVTLLLWHRMGSNFSVSDCCSDIHGVSRTHTVIVMYFFAVFDHAVVLCSSRLVLLPICAHNTSRVCLFFCVSLYPSLCVCVCVLREFPSVACFSQFDISWRICVRDSLTLSVCYSSLIPHSSVFLSSQSLLLSSFFTLCVVFALCSILHAFVSLHLCLTPFLWHTHTTALCTKHTARMQNHMLHNTSHLSFLQTNMTFTIPITVSQFQSHLFSPAAICRLFFFFSWLAANQLRNDCNQLN